MPRMPDAGRTVPSQASGAMSSPKSAIDGTVWITLSSANKGRASRSRRAAAMPSGTPNSSAGSSVENTICAWRPPAAWNTSCRFAYSFSSDNWSSAPDISSASTGNSTPTRASADPTAPSFKRCKASAAASQDSSTRTQKPPPSDTRAMPDPPGDSCVASSPASATQPASSSVAAIATAACVVRVEGMHTAAPNISAGPSSARRQPTSNPGSATPVPDSRRFGATLTKASPPAAASAASTSTHSTRLWTQAKRRPPCPVASAGAGASVT